MYLLDQLSYGKVIIQDVGILVISLRIACTKIAGLIEKVNFVKYDNHVC